MKKNDENITDDFFEPTDDLDESEIIYEGGKPEEIPSEECYDYDEFLSVEGTIHELKKENNNPWVSAGVIATVIAFCALMFRLFL